MIRGRGISFGGGSGGSGGGEALDPVQVYNDTRPADWLPMPTPAENEIYLLFHIPDGVSSLLAFTTTCTGNYTVDVGTVTNGVFVSNSTTTVASGSIYKAELFADNFGNITIDGLKQAMIRVSGTDITEWAPSAHSKKPSPSGYKRWDIVEISCNLPKGTAVSCGNTTMNSALCSLRYFSWYGTNALVSTNSMFTYCTNLVTVREMNTENVTDMYGMFRFCYLLMAAPKMNTQNVTNMSYVFGFCYSLKSVPEMNTENVTDMSGMFYNCYSLKSVPKMNTENVTNISKMFISCMTLKSVPEMNTENVTNMSNMFSSCYSLKSVPEMNTENVTDMSTMFRSVPTLKTVPPLDIRSAENTGNMFESSPTIESVLFVETNINAKRSISLSGCSLSHIALVKLFNSLPQVTSGSALTITGNPGVSELTNDEKAIATGKGWSLTV